MPDWPRRGHCLRRVVSRRKSSPPLGAMGRRHRPTGSLRSPVAAIVGPLWGRRRGCLLGPKGRSDMRSLVSRGADENGVPGPQRGRRPLQGRCNGQSLETKTPCLAAKRSPNSSHGWSEAEPVVIVKSGTGPRRGPTGRGGPVRLRGHLSLQDIQRKRHYAFITSRSVARYFGTPVFASSLPSYSSER